MKIVEKRLIPVKIYPICELCNVAMEKDKKTKYDFSAPHIYKCPNCGKEEKSDTYYPCVKYVGEDE